MNWYLVLEPHQLSFRNALGSVRTIRYDDITRARLGRQYNATRLTVGASDGTRFSVNPGTFDVSPLLKAPHDRTQALRGYSPAALPSRR